MVTFHWFKVIWVERKLYIPPAYQNNGYVLGVIMPKEFNMFDHVLVPKHILLSKEEAEQVLKELGVKPWQLPWIKASDPAAKALGAKPGDIIKIIRKSPTAGTSVAYRFVVPDVWVKS